MADTELLASLRHALSSVSGLRLAVLFGSQARGDSGPDSDVDVAVLGNRLDRLRLASELSRLLEREVDLVDLSEPSIALVRAVLRDGIAVYESSPGVWGAFIGQSLCDLETDLPAFRRMQDAFVRRVAASGLLGER